MFLTAGNNSSRLQEMHNKIIHTQDLKQLSTPEETVRVLREVYANPMKEILRRKDTAQKEGHHKNIQFWQTVETILSPVN